MLDIRGKEQTHRVGRRAQRRPGPTLPHRTLAWQGNSPGRRDNPKVVVGAYREGSQALGGGVPSPQLDDSPHPRPGFLQGFLTW